MRTDSIAPARAHRGTGFGPILGLPHIIHPKAFTVS